MDVGLSAFREINPILTFLIFNTYLMLSILQECIKLYLAKNCQRTGIVTFFEVILFIESVPKNTMPGIRYDSPLFPMILTMLVVALVTMMNVPGD